MGYPRTACFFPGRVGNGVCNNFSFPSRPGPTRPDPTRPDTTGDLSPPGPIQNPPILTDLFCNFSPLPEASRRPPGGLPKASRRSPGGIPEASRRLPGGFPEASRRPPGGLPEASRRPPGRLPLCSGFRGRPKVRLTLQRFLRTPKTTSHAAAVYVGTPAKRLQSEPPFREGEPLCSLYVGTRILCLVLRAPGGPREHVKYEALEAPEKDLPSAAVGVDRGPTARFVQEWRPPRAQSV